MRKLIVLALVVALLLVGDQVARVLVEGRLADRAREAATDESGASADITAFPFLGRLAASGSVPKVRVRVDRPRAGPLRLTSVVVEASGVALDRGRLASGRVRVEGIDGGSVAVVLGADALSDVLDVPVTVGDGRVGVGVAGATVTADAEVAEGALVLRVAGLPALRVPIPRTELVPCAVTALAVEGDRLRLSCEVDELPAPLRR